MTEAQLFELFFPYPDRGDRRVRVYVPKHEEGERFPVIYMTDGQNLFDRESCTWGCWETMRTVDEEQQNGLGGAIIVGIDHGGVYRDNELTPGSIGEVVHASEMDNFTAPEGEIFDDFVMNTVKPAIEKQFPVLTGVKHTAICGSSSGGLQAYFTGLEHSDVFGMIGAFSPAFLLYAEDDFRAWSLSKMKAVMPYLYLYSGSGDPLEEKIFQCTEAAYDMLTENGYPYDCLNEVLLFENKHNEAAWEGVFKDFLHTFLFRAQ